MKRKKCRTSLEAFLLVKEKSEFGPQIYKCEMEKVHRDFRERERERDGNVEVQVPCSKDRTLLSLAGILVIYYIN